MPIKAGHIAEEAHGSIRICRVLIDANTFECVSCAKLSFNYRWDFAGTDIFWLKQGVRALVSQGPILRRPDLRSAFALVEEDRSVKICPRNTQYVGVVELGLETLLDRLEHRQTGGVIE